jgi:hypothetical protein
MSAYNTSYQVDIVAWANEQARLLRAGRFDLLDLHNLAEEIEDVGKSEKCELKSRMAVLLVHLLKWQYQPERQCGSWQRTIREQRRGIQRAVDETPSLGGLLTQAIWWDDVWSDAVSQAANETGLGDRFPEVCTWSVNEVLGDWLPT